MLYVFNRFPVHYITHFEKVPLQNVKYFVKNPVINIMCCIMVRMKRKDFKAGYLFQNAH